MGQGRTGQGAGLFATEQGTGFAMSDSSILSRLDEDAQAATSGVAAAETEREVGPDTYCPPRHPTRSHPSIIEFSCIL
jgi:hypothetical protein